MGTHPTPKLAWDEVQVGAEAPAVSHELGRTDLVHVRRRVGRLQPDAHRRGRGPGRRPPERVRPRHVLDGPARPGPHRLGRRRQPHQLQGPLHQADLAGRDADHHGRRHRPSGTRTGDDSSTSTPRSPTRTARSRWPARPPSSRPDQTPLTSISPAATTPAPASPRTIRERATTGPRATPARCRPGGGQQETDDVERGAGGAGHLAPVGQAVEERSQSHQAGQCPGIDDAG